MKVDVDEVESVLLKKKFDNQKVQEVIAELAKIVEELKKEKDDEPKTKWEHVIVLNDKEGHLTGKEIAGWVVQIPEDEDVGLTLSKIVDAVKDQNEATKKKKNFITNFVQAFESLKPKFLKKKIRIKTKELTRVLITNGNF